MGILLKIPERHCRTVFFRLFRLADNSPLSCIKIYPLKNAILEAENSLLSDHDTCSKQAHKSPVIVFNIQLVSVAFYHYFFWKGFYILYTNWFGYPLQEKIAIAVSCFIITYQDFFTIYFSESNQNRTIFRTIICL